MQAGSDGAERDRRLLDRLVDIRSAKADDPDGSATDAAYADAFQEAGIDLAALPPAEAGARIKARPPATALALAAALDDWAAVRRRSRGDRIGAKRLSDAARAADPDPWRAGPPRRPGSDGQVGPADRAASRRPGRRGSTRWAPSAWTCWARPWPVPAIRRTAEAVLRAAQRRHPGDVWVNYDLARVCEKRNRRDEAIRFYTAARSIRPETAHELAHLLEQKGESDEAIAVFQDLARLRRETAPPDLPRPAAAESRPHRKRPAPVLEAAVAAAREAIRLKPDDSWAYVRLGLALRAQGKLDDAVAAHRVAIRLNPGERQGPLPPRRRPERRRGTKTTRSPNTARRSGSSPITTGPTSTSATPCMPRGSWTTRSPTYRVAIAAQARAVRGPQQPRLRPEAPREVRRGDRRLRRGDPAQARPRAGLPNARRHPGIPGEVRGGTGRIASGSRTGTARLASGPRLARLHPGTLNS